MNLATMFFGSVPCAVARSLREEPDSWSEYVIGAKVFELTHRSGWTLWTANSAYGMKLHRRSVPVWGDVTVASTFGISPGHWLTRLAANRWIANYSATKDAPSKAEAVRALLVQPKATHP